MAAANHVGDSPLFLLDYLLRFLRVAVLLAIWRAILAGKGTVSGMTMESVLTYTLIAEVFAGQLACRTGIELAIWQGSIATRLLQPIGIVGQLVAEMAGRWGIAFGLVSLPLLLGAPLLGVSPLPAGAAAGACFVPSLALAIAAGVAVDFLFALIVVWLGTNIWIIESFRTAVGALLSGAVLPLALLPWSIGRVFEWLPFAAMASAPPRIYTGTGPPAALLAMQAGWCVVLWWLVGRMWRANREKLASHGG